MKITDLLVEFTDYNYLVVLLYLCKDKKRKIEIEYNDLEEEIGFSKYKQKQAIDYLTEKEFISVEEKGKTKNKSLLIEIDFDNKIIETILGVIESMEQLEIVQGLTGKTYIQEESDNPITGFPFKLSGNKFSDLYDYSLKKYIMADKGKIDWKDITPRDLAVIFSMVTNAKFDNMKTANWAGSLINKHFLKRKEVTKENFCTIAVEFQRIYYEDFNNEMGITWNYIAKHHNHREKILDKVIKRVYTNNKYEELPSFF